MIRECLILLANLDHFAESENIEIAKGKNKIVKSYKDVKQKVKRVHKWQLKR